MKKLISLLLCIFLIIGSCPVTVFSIDLNLEKNDISFEEFSAQAIDLMQTENVVLFSDDAVEEDKEADTNRLIVKSKKNEIDTCGAVGYVNGYEDLHILQYASDEECDEALAFYQEQSYIEYVQEDDFCESEEVEGETLPNPMQSVSDQFGYTALEAYLSENNITYTDEIVVAVVDSGIANDHEYLKDKVQPTGFNSINPEGTCYDDRGHGTHVAGIIAANTHDNVVIRPYKVLDQNGVGTELQVYLGIEQAINDGADIINLSLSRRGESEILHEVITTAYNAGVIVVCSAGNKGASLDEVYFSPASFDEVVTVMSCSNDLYVSDFSNYGSKCEVAAPGENIVSTHLNNTYKALSGTSMSAPFISAAIAYILSAYPGYNQSQVLEEINNNTQPCKWVPAGKYINAAFLTRVKERSTNPKFSYTRPTFSEPFDLVISTTDKNANIYYNTSNMQVGEYALYSEPIPINYDMTVSAYTVIEGAKPSLSLTVSYTKMPSDASLFTVDSYGNLIGYSGEDKNPVVPNIVNGIAVKAIAKTAFSGNTDIQSVSVLTNTTTIEANAFSGCTNLEFFRGANITSVGKNAFKDCADLEYIKAPKLSVVGYYAFYGCSKLKNFAFNNVTEVGDSAFEGCSSLINLGSNSIYRVGSRAFAGTNFTNVDLSLATDIGSGAFSDCVNFTTFKAPRISYVYARMFEGCNKLIEVDIQGVENIEAGTFQDNTNIESVNAASAVNISESAFKGCENLNDIQLGALKKIGAYAFYGTAVESLALDKVVSVSDYAFAQCSKLKTAKLDKAVSIGAYAFEGCVGLVEVSFDSVKNVSETAFAGCAGLKNVSMDSVESINLFMFEDGDNYIENLSFNNAKSFIYDETTGGFTLIDVFPKLKSFSAVKLEIVPDNTFKNCDYTMDFSMTELKSVGDYAFYGTDIEKVESQKLETIGKHAFNKCHKLTIVNAPNAFEVGAYAFANCPALTSVNLDSIESFDTDIVKNSEEYITTISINNAKAIKTAGESSVFGNKFPNLTTLYVNSLTEISESFLNGAVKLTDISMENAVVIGAYAFNCTAVSTVTLGDGVSVCPYAFSGCSELNSVTLLGDADISENAFVNCPGLTSFIADGLETFDFKMLDGCTGLKTLSLNGAKDFVGEVTETNNFGIYESLEILYLNGLVDIPQYLCHNTAKLKEIYIENAATIGEGAFKGSGIAEITLNAGVAIREYAFSDCSGLSSLTLVGNADVGEYAFANCPNLTSFVADDLETFDFKILDGCTGLKTLSLNGVKGFVGGVSESYNFGIYENLEELYLNGLVDVPQYICHNTTKLKKLYINGAENINGLAFEGNTSLKEIYANNVKNVDADTFKYCSNIESIELASLESVPEKMFYQMKTLKNVDVSSAKTIGDYAFAESGIVNVELAQIEKIGDYAFSDSNIEGFVADKLTDMGEGVFCNTRSLVNVSIDSVEVLDSFLFFGVAEDELAGSMYMKRLQTFSADKIKRIPSNFFEGSSLRSVVFEKVEVIGEAAFMNCNSLTNAKVPAVREIGAMAFKGAALEKIEAPELQKVEIGVFEKCDFETFVAPKVTIIEEGAFNCCYWLETIDCPEVTRIGKEAFLSCNNLKTVDCANVTVIEEGTFRYCYDLETIDCPNIKEVGDYAFYNCSALDVRDILSTVETIGAFAFYGVNDVEGLWVQLTNLKVVKDNGFEGFGINGGEPGLTMPDIVELNDLPECGIVLVGSNLEEMNCSGDDVTVFAPVQNQYVKNYCEENGLEYVEFNSETAIEYDVASVKKGSRSLYFDVYGFNLKYQWYGAYKADLSDAEAIRNATRYSLSNSSLGDYPYVYCVATSTENGNEVIITSNVCRSVDNCISLGEACLEEYYYLWSGQVLASDKPGITQENLNSVFEIADGYTYKLVGESVTTGYLGSDVVVEVYYGDELIKEYIFLVMGDINCDGFVDVLDVAEVSRYMEKGECSGKLGAVDMNINDEIDIADYQLLVNKALST